MEQVNGFSAISETEMVETNGGIALAVGLIGSAVAFTFGFLITRT